MVNARCGLRLWFLKPSSASRAVGDGLAAGGAGRVGDPQRPGRPGDSIARSAWLELDMDASP